jgi:hypothetical protein
MPETFRDRFLTPRVARAVTSPSAILATGAGAAAAILVGLGPIGAVAVGAGAWAARVLAAVPRARRGADAVSPRSLDEPWRCAVEQVQDSRRRFGDALRGMDEGPLRDRLGAVADQLDTAVQEAWRIGRAGHVLAGGRRRIDAADISRELDAARAAPPTPRQAETVAALESQLAAAARLDATIADARDRLRLLDARTDEAVTRAVELSVAQADPSEVAALDGAVSGIVGELEALRQAIEETDAAGASGVSSPPGSQGRSWPGTRAPGGGPG